MKLDYKRTFLVGFGFFGISILWTLYNAYVPIFLQTGSATFNAPGEVGFGLGAGLTGIVMTLDNVAAFFLLPIIGVWSDRTRTRLGRRLPFILAFSPIAIAAFILIPVSMQMIPPELSGKVGELGTPLAIFMIAIGVFLTAMACFRTPVITLMPDLTPSPLRSQANGIINLMGGVGTLIATLGSGFLYGMGRIAPFAFGGVLMAAGQAPLLMGVASLAFLAFAVPSGHIATRVGRRRTIIIGLAVFGLLLAANFFLRSALLIWPVMAIGGLGWALVNINSLPMVVDIAASDADLGTYTGLYYIASQLAAVAGPTINGYIVEWGGGNYNLIFLVTPAFFLLAILCMLNVTRGEAHEGLSLDQPVKSGAS